MGKVLKQFIPVIFLHQNTFLTEVCALFISTVLKVVNNLKVMTDCHFSLLISLSIFYI